jgi:hypothetical protein
MFAIYHRGLGLALAVYAGIAYISMFTHNLRPIVLNIDLCREMAHATPQLFWWSLARSFRTPNLIGPRDFYQARRLLDHIFQPWDNDEVSLIDKKRSNASAQTLTT